MDADRIADLTMVACRHAPTLDRAAVALRWVCCDLAGHQSWLDTDIVVFGDDQAALRYLAGVKQAHPAAASGGRPVVGACLLLDSPGHGPLALLVTPDRARVALAPNGGGLVVADLEQATTMLHPPADGRVTRLAVAATTVSRWVVAGRN
jgi:hypothetical protein